MLSPLVDPLIEIVIPVYNEERQLETSILTLNQYLPSLTFRYQITIADNGSTNQTTFIAERLAASHERVSLLRLEQKGRGRALKRAWTEGHADVFAYMDVDLSTGLTALLPLVSPLVSGHSGVAIGSRLLANSKVSRGLKREVLSRGYNLLIRALFRPGFHDAQCGFKAVRADAARKVLPHIRDNGWFFDTELLLLARRNGIRISEIPVDWVDDPDSRVKIRSTVTADLQGLWRVRRLFWAGGGLVDEAGDDDGQVDVHREEAIGTVRE